LLILTSRRISPPSGSRAAVGRFSAYSGGDGRGLGRCVHVEGSLIGLCQRVTRANRGQGMRSSARHAAFPRCWPSWHVRLAGFAGCSARTYM
jgi:hypothetical protein